MLKKMSWLLATVLVLAAGLSAQNIVDEIIARINGSIITRADLEKGKTQSLDDLKQRFPSDWQQKWTDRQKDVLRDLIDQQLLTEKGKDLGITGDNELTKRLNEMRKQMGLENMEDLEKAAKEQGVSYEDFKDQIRNNIVTQQVVGKEVGSHIHVTNEDIQSWYRKHEKDLESPEQVKLSEILISTESPGAAPDGKEPNSKMPQLPDDPARAAAAEAKAKQILEELRKGADFAELAKKDSDGSTAPQGGELGEFKRGELAKELEDQTFAMKAGDLSGVTRTKQGFIILKVTAHLPPGVPPIKDIEDRIREAVYVEKLEPATRAYLTKLREEAYIDMRPGYLDTGASANQSKPVLLAAAAAPDTPSTAKIKKKKHFLLF